MAIMVGSGYYVPMLTTYVLVIEKAGSSRVQIGKKRILMENGIYLYVGSAKKGLAQRLARHARKEKKRFWHIDYVTSRRRHNACGRSSFPRQRSAKRLAPWAG